MPPRARRARRRARVELGRAARAAARGRSRWPAISSCSARLALAEPLERALERARPPCAPRARPRPAAARRRRARRRGAARGLGGRAAAQLEVLLDPAGQVAHAAVADQRVDVVADALDEVAVVADDHERARASRRAGPRARSACRCRGRWSARRAAARSARPSAAASAAAAGARRPRGRATSVRACSPRKPKRSHSCPAVSSRPSPSVARPRTASSASSTRRWPGISAVSWERWASRTVAPRSTRPRRRQLAREQLRSASSCPSR